MPDIQEYRGIRGLVAAEITKDDHETFEADTPFAVSGVAELSRTTETNSEAHYYDNVPAVVIDSTGSDEVTISASAIPFDVLAKITGQYYDEATGMFVEGERESKYFAIGYITEKTDGTEVFVWRLKGKFNIPDSTHATKDDGAEANGQEIVFTGINTTHKFTINGKQKTAKAVNVDTSVNAVAETEFFATVQTPDTVKAA
jgi:phi13 family phage major tail protein